MSSIVHRVYDVALEMDNDISVPYNPSRKINTTLTGRHVDIHYAMGRERMWYLRLGGSYPLSVSQEVCACSPGVHKTRQRAVQRFGHPYGETETDVPAWVWRLTVKHAPDWFPFPEF